MFGGLLSVTSIVAVQGADDATPSLTTNVTEQLMAKPEEVSTVKIGVALVASSKAPPGQSVVHE